MVIGQLGMVGLGIIDFLVIGRVGPNELAAVGLGNTWSFATLIFGLGVAMGVDPLLTQAYGARDLRAAASAMQHGAIWLLVASAAIMALHLLVGPALILLQQPPELIPDASAYARIVGLSVFPALAFALHKQILQANGEMSAATVVIVLANLVNLVLDLLLVWWLDAGVPGVAWATVGVRWFMLAVLLWLGRKELAPALQTVLLTRDELVRVGRIAFPVGWQVGFEVWAFNATMFLAGTLGAEAVATHTAALSLTSVAFMVPMGLGSAATTRVGNLVGAGLDWRPAGAHAVFLGGACMLLSGCLFIFAPSLLGRIYVSDPEAVARIAAVLPIAGVFGLFDGVQVVALGVLRGLGDTRFGAGVALFAYWVLALPLAVFGAWNWGLPGVWWAICAGLAAASILLLLRLRGHAR